MNIGNLERLSEGESSENSIEIKLRISLVLTQINGIYEGAFPRNSQRSHQSQDKYE